MSLKSGTVDVLKLHAAGLLFGGTGLFAKLIMAPAMAIACSRMLFGLLALLLLFGVKREKIAFPGMKHLLLMLAGGMFLAGHWFTFFYSIQCSSVAIGAVTFATFPLFSAFLEPVLFKKKFEKKYLVASIAVLIGIYLMCGEISLSSSSLQGVFWGEMSALSFALLSMLNARLTMQHGSLVINFWQYLGGVLLFLPFYYGPIINAPLNDLLLMVLLGVVFTAAAHTLYVSSMRSVNVRTASIVAGSLESVYAVIFASFILSEIPDFRAMTGMAIVIVTAGLISLNPPDKKQR